MRAAYAPCYQRIPLLAAQVVYPPTASIKLHERKEGVCKPCLKDLYFYNYLFLRMG